MNSLEASSSTSQSYKVFLSFHGKDTRHNFTDHLYTKLLDTGYQVFRDNEAIGNGQMIESTLQLAIQQSKVSIVVLSENYASSKWCLKEVEMIMNLYEQGQQTVIPVFYYVDPSDVRHQRGSFAEAFAQHEDSEEREIVEGWRAALEKVGKIRGEHFNVTQERYEAPVITKIVEDVGRIKGLKKRKYVFHVPEMVGEGFKEALNNIWSMLTEYEIARIGVCGMGGIGKTTLVKHINKQLQEQFSEVYWVTASQDCDILKLQDRIAKRIDFKLSDEEDSILRAGELANELAKKGSFVIIVDDLWDYFDLEEDIGLPKGGYKLMFTTRSVDVCRKMKCREENIIKIKQLCPEEAWALFEREHGDLEDIKVEAYAKEIVKECGGLPLAIKTIGSSTRRIKDEVGWRNAVKKIIDPTIGKSDMDTVFPILRYSYSCLNDDPSLQQCLLYCALFPKDYWIERGQLIEYLIVEGIIKREKCRREETDEGHVMLNNLVNLCLLEKSDFDGTVKMHDLIRDMALKILSEESPVIVKAGMQLKECPDADEWEQRPFRVSLMSSKIREIGSDDWQPICPNLSTLLLSENHKLVKISDSFFQGLDGLKVLDLTNTSIQRLPGSISNLVRLSALLLGGCDELEHIPSLVKLKELEKLYLRGCRKIEKLPHGMEFLPKLRYLDLTNCLWPLKEFPTGILPKLSRLQVLRTDQDLILDAEEVGRLEKLEHLSCGFPNLAEFNKYLGFAQSLYKFQIFVHPIGKWKFRNSKFWPSQYIWPERVDYIQLDSLKILNISNVSMGGDFGKFPKGMKYLRFRDCIMDAGGLSDYACVLNGANELKTIDLIECEGVECIASVFGLAANIFSTLENIKLLSLRNLRSLIPYEDDNDDRNSGPLALALPSTKTFAFLKTIMISECQSMKKLFPRDLLHNLQNLEDISVRYCDGLVEIVTSTEENSSDYSSRSVTLPKLRNLTLSDLPSLQSIYSGKLICEALQTLTLVECGMLKTIPISLPLPSISEITVGPRTWWEQEVEWDHPHAKQILQPLVGYENRYWWKQEV